MTRFKDFGSGNSGQDIEPIKFKLHGEEFECIPEIQGSVLLTIVGNTGEDNPSASASMITDFFAQVLVDDSAKRFYELINSKDRIVSIETLGEITGWVIEEYTNRPEKQPED